jgi:hypothetical protein
VQNLLAASAGRALDQDFGVCPEKSELVPTLEEPSKNAGHLSCGAVLKAALQGPGGGYNLRDASQLESTTNHMSRIRPTTRITKRVCLRPHDADNQ